MAQDDENKGVKVNTKDPDSEIDSTPRASQGIAWLAGAIGAGLSLAVGEVGDRASTALTSLVVGVGNLFVDLTPGDVIATSINTVGSAQKPILLTGITVGSILIGGWIGVVGRKRPAAVAIGFLAFGILGAIATARDPLTNGFGSVVFSLFAALVGGAVTLLLLQLAASDAQAQANNAKPAKPGSELTLPTGRRRLLAFGGAAAGAAALGIVGRVGRTSAAQQARDAILTDSGAPAATGVNGIPLPAGPFDDINGITRRITSINPTDDFYLIDTALSKPQVDPVTWSLTIDGPFVDNPISFTYDELLAREQIEREVTLSCVSNPVGGQLVGNALWTGIPITELLDEAGVQDPTNPEHQFFSTSVDGFTCGFRLPLAYDGRTAMLALMMNGEPLPINHGFPARLVIAGLYGYVSATKWIERIEITDFVGVDGFWQPRGWAKEGPVKTQSRIDVPQSRAQLTAGPTPIAGIAFSPSIGIERVEVSIGEVAELTGDEIWEEAELADVDTDETWRQWRYEWNAPPGDHLIRVRATDVTGFTQSPIPVNPAPDGAEGFHTVIVRVT